MAGKDRIKLYIHPIWLFVILGVTICIWFDTTGILSLVGIGVTVGFLVSVLLWR